MRNGTLRSLAYKAETMWPAICYKGGGSRAKSAAKLVADGKVIDTGNGMYQVGDHTASFEDKYCACLDRAPVDPKLGPLCKHRLAIMFTLSKAMRSENTWLGERIAELGAMASNGWFELVFETDYDAPHIKRCIGYSLNGSTATRFADSRQVTLEQLQSALSAAGLGMDGLPRKLPDWSYAFRFSPNGKSKLNEATWTHKGITEAMIERAKWQLGPDEAAKLRAQMVAA